MLIPVESEILSLGKLSSSEIIWRNPLELVSTSRLDIISRAIFLRALQGLAPIKDSKIYYEVIKASNPGFFEKDTFGEKRSKKDFEKNFIRLYESFKNEGFRSDISVIALNSLGEPLNGAHRIATAIALNLKVPTISIQTRVSHDFSPNALLELGVNKDNLRMLLWDYYSRKKELKSYLVFSENQDALSMLVDFVGRESIIFIDSQVLTINQVFNLNLEMYQHEEWFRKSDDSHRLIRGRIGDFVRDRIHFGHVIVGNSTFGEMQLIKEEIRNRIGRGNLPIHSVQDEFENEYLLRCLLHRESRKFILRRSNNCSARLHQRINGPSYGASPKTEKVLRRDCVVSGSLILEEHAIRRAQDVDLIVLDSRLPDNFNHQSYDNHLVEIEEVFNASRDPLVFQRFFYGDIETFCHLGMLWLTPNSWKEILQSRKDSKAKIDKFLLNLLPIFGGGMHRMFPRIVSNFLYMLRRIVGRLSPRCFKRSLARLR